MTDVCKTAPLFVEVNASVCIWRLMYAVFIDPAAGRGTDRYRSVNFVVRMRDARVIYKHGYRW